MPREKNENEIRLSYEVNLHPNDVNTEGFKLPLDFKGRELEAICFCFEALVDPFPSYARDPPPTAGT
jgi:hypothetical protein